jgi:hypothetical protein
MIKIKPLVANRVRRIGSSFAFIEHRFLRDGFWAELTHQELVFYFFLVLVADRNGMSWYGYDKLCALLSFTLDEYIWVRDSLIAKDLIAFDGRRFQVLSLPDSPASTTRPLLTTADDMRRADPATIHQIISHSLGR